MSTILDHIAADKREEVDALKKVYPLSELRNEMPEMESHRFAGALSDPAHIHIIAEIKKASPSRGLLLPDFDPVQLARAYASGGASALSVLTESKYFQGSFDNLKLAAEASALPVLCKDFILEPYQVYHARYCGADAILLIVALLTTEAIVECMEVAGHLGVDCLVEVHNENELRTAVDVGASIIGVNNRDLRDFSVKIETSERLANGIPSGTIKVSESGISEYADIARLSKSGFSVFLIGEALVKSHDPGDLIRSFRGV